MGARQRQDLFLLVFLVFLFHFYIQTPGTNWALHKQLFDERSDGRNSKKRKFHWIGGKKM